MDINQYISDMEKIYIINYRNCILIAIFFYTIAIQAQLREPINPLNIEKIEIKAINPGITGVGAVSYDRKYFDEIFEYSKNNETTVQWELKQTDEINLFSLLINESVPYEEKNIEVYPNEINTNYENHNWLYGSYHISETNDPIGTKMKISFYLKTGIQENIFASDHTIDFRNYRYSITETMKMYFELKFIELGVYSVDWLEWLKQTK